MNRDKYDIWINLFELSNFEISTFRSYKYKEKGGNDYSIVQEIIGSLEKEYIKITFQKKLNGRWPNPTAYYQNKYFKRYLKGRKIKKINEVYDFNHNRSSTILYIDNNDRVCGSFKSVKDEKILINIIHCNYTNSRIQEIERYLSKEIKLATRGDNRAEYTDNNKNNKTDDVSKENTTQLSSITKDNLCKWSLKILPEFISWDTHSSFIQYVKEAKRRGYTPESCARVLGRTTQVANSSKTNKGTSLASWDQKKLCKYALPRKDRSTVWDTSSYYGKYVTEAKRRGYTPKSCAKYLGRTTQIAKKSEPKKKQDVAPVSKPATKLASEANKLKCEYKLASYHSPIVDGKKFVIDLRNGRLYRKSDYVELRQKAKELQRQGLLKESRWSNSDVSAFVLTAHTPISGLPILINSLMDVLFISGADVYDPDGKFDKTLFHPFQNSSTATHTSVISYRISKDYITPISHQIIFDKEEAYSSAPGSVKKVTKDLLKNFGYEMRTKGSGVVKEILHTANSVGPYAQPMKYQLSTGEADQRWAISFRTATTGSVQGFLDGERSSLRIKGSFGELNLFGTCEPIPSDIIIAKKPKKLKMIKAGPSPESDIHFGKYHALVIGNNDYLHLPDLKTAMADAKAVREVLVNDYGFDTKLLLNATRDDLLEALDGYKERLQYDDNLLIYYAGHGYLDETQDRGYWLPVDAKEEATSRWVANDDVTANLRSIAAKHILVVADSCYSGTLTRSVSMKSQPQAERTALIRQYVKQKVRVALTSGGLEPVVDSGGSGHSVFAEAFLDALNANTDVLLGHELYTKIRGPVLLNAPQSPRYDNIRFSGHKEGDFLFVSKRTLKASVEEPTQADMLFWQSVKDSSNVDMVREYLKQFPDGMFAGLARIRIKELEAAR